MQSRRDQVQAQSYLLGRLTAALVTAELDTLETPHRRTVTGLIGGVLLAALVAGGFTVYGLFVPGGATSWQQAGKLVVEKETGSQYLYIGGTLRPVLNYTSARLLIGEQPAVDSVSSRSLAGTPRGTAIGIVGAPDSLPAQSLAGRWWTACAPSATDQAGQNVTALTLTIGTAAVGQALGPHQAALVHAAGDDAMDYLIWNGHRLRLSAPWVAPVLGYDAATTVPPAWLDLIPAGVDLGPIDVPGRGADGPEIDGQPTRIGQLFTAGADRYYLLRADGLSRLTATAYALLAGDPATAKAYRDSVVTATAISPAALARVPVSLQSDLGGGLPETPPPLASAGGLTWCLRSVTGGAAELVAARPAPASAITRTGVGVTRTALTADAVAVTAGIGGLALGGRPGAAPGSTYYLVTDAGVKYPLAGAKVGETLGYPPANAAVVSPDLLDLLPDGPLLDPARVVG